MDASADGRETRPGQKLSRRRGTRKEKHLARQFGNHREGFRIATFETVGQGLVSRLGSIHNLHSEAHVLDCVRTVQTYPDCIQAVHHTVLQTCHIPCPDVSYAVPRPYADLCHRTCGKLCTRQNEDNWLSLWLTRGPRDSWIRNHAPGVHPMERRKIETTVLPARGRSLTVRQALCQNPTRIRTGMLLIRLGAHPPPLPCDNHMVLTRPQLRAGVPMVNPAVYLPRKGGCPDSRVSRPSVRIWPSAVISRRRTPYSCRQPLFWESSRAVTRNQPLRARSELTDADQGAFAALRSENRLGWYHSANLRANSTSCRRSSSTGPSFSYSTATNPWKF